MISYVLRFPVSVFFMISGYYSTNKDIAWIKRKALWTLKLIIYSELCYGLLNIILNYARGISPVDYLTSVLSKIQIGKLLLSGTLFCGPLWYLYALFWSWLLLILVRKVFSHSMRAYILIPVLLFVALVGRNLPLGDPEETIWLFRNGLLYGLPFMLLGSWFWHVKDCFNERTPFIFLAVGLGLIVIEYIINPVIHDFQLSTVFTATALFLLALRFETVPVRFSVLNKIGAELSMWVYLTHVAVRSVTDFLAEYFNYANLALYQWLRTILIIGLSIIVSYWISSVKKWSKRASGPPFFSSPGHS